MKFVVVAPAASMVHAPVFVKLTLPEASTEQPAESKALVETP